MSSPIRSADRPGECGAGNLRWWNNRDVPAIARSHWLRFFVLAPAGVTVRVQPQGGLNQKAPALYSAAVFFRPRPPRGHAAYQHPESTGCETRWSRQMFAAEEGEDLS